MGATERVDVTTTDIQFNLDLLKFMRATVRIPADTDGKEYRVFGINWDTDELMIFDHPPVHYAFAEIVYSDNYSEDDEEAGWYKA